MEKAITESVENDKQIDVDYFYRLLCTSENMILVHTKCHPNVQHVGKHVDPDKMFKGPTNSNSFAPATQSQDKEMDANESPGPSGLNGLRVPLGKRKRQASENGQHHKKMKI